MDAQLEKLKHEVEADLGRHMDVGEEIELKGLFYFSKGVELKNELESEPVHIKTILPAVMANIRRRMGLQCKQDHHDDHHDGGHGGYHGESRGEHQHRVISAVGDFLGGNAKRSRKAKRMSKERRLF